MDLLEEYLQAHLCSLPSSCNVKKVILHPTAGLEDWTPSALVEPFKLPSGCSVFVNADAVLEPCNKLLSGVVQPPKVTAIFKVQNIRKHEMCELEENKFSIISSQIRKRFPTIGQAQLSQINKHVRVDDKALLAALRSRARLAQSSGTQSGVFQYAGGGRKFRKSEKRFWPIAAFRGGEGSEMGYDLAASGGSLFVSELGTDGQIGIYRQKIAKEKRMKSIEKWARDFLLQDGSVNLAARCKKTAVGGTYCFSTWKYKYYVIAECRADTKTCSLFLEKTRGPKVQCTTVGEFANSRFYRTYVARCQENVHRLAFRFSTCTEIGLVCNTAPITTPICNPLHFHAGFRELETEGQIAATTIRQTVYEENPCCQSSSSSSFSSSSSTSASSDASPKNSASSSSSLSSSSSSSSSSAEEGNCHDIDYRTSTAFNQHVITVDHSLSLPASVCAKWVQMSHCLEEHHDDRGKWVIIHGSTTSLSTETIGKRFTPNGIPRSRRPPRMCVRLPPLQGYTWLKIPKSNVPVFTEKSRSCVPTQLSLFVPPLGSPCISKAPDLSCTFISQERDLARWDAAFSNRPACRENQRGGPRCGYHISESWSQSQNVLRKEERRPFFRLPDLSDPNANSHKKYNTLLVYGANKNLVEAGADSPMYGVYMPANEGLPLAKEAIKALDEVFLRPSDAVHRACNGLHSEMACAVFQNLNPRHCTERETGFISVVPSMCRVLATSLYNEPSVVAEFEEDAGFCTTKANATAEQREERVAQLLASFDKGEGKMTIFSPVCCVGSYPFVNFG